MTLRLAFIGAAIGALATTGCGSDDGGGGETVNPDGTHNQYVADTISLPSSAAEAMQLGLDLDGDDVVDNALGQTLSALGSQGVDLQAPIDEAVATASIVLLADVQATALDNATGVGFSVFLGTENTTPAACTNPDDITTCGNHLDGSGSFEVDPASPSDALIVGSILGGSFQTSTVGSITLELNLVDGVPPITLNLIGARAAFSVTASNLMSGKLGGAITEDEARNNLLPVVVQLVKTTVADGMCVDGADGCECIVDGMTDDTAETILSIFDTDMDCTVTDAEVENNSLVGTVLSPDADLLDASGNLGSDGVDDSISLGLGFTGVGATFAAP